MCGYGEHTAHRGEAGEVVGHPVGFQVRQLQIQSPDQPLSTKKEVQNWSLSYQEEFLQTSQCEITRRQYFWQVQSLLDPNRFLSPVFLRAQVLLRRTSEEDCK